MLSPLILKNPERDQPFVTVVVVTRNSMSHLKGCLGTMTDQTYRFYRILVVDSGSTDSTVSYIQSHFNMVKVMPIEGNPGYRRGNQIGMMTAEGEYVVVCNDDVEVDRCWLETLVQAMEGNPSLGLVTPRILLHNDPDRINVAGNTLHYSGLYGSRGLGEPSETYREPEDIAAVSGCCFMIRREALEQLNGFSKDFDHLDTGWHASYEDVDLSWRAQLSGWGIGYVPQSFLYHKYKRKPTTPEMFCSYEWGRLLLVLRNYSVMSLILVFPILMALEVLSWGYALLKGRRWIQAKWKVWTWLVKNTGMVRSMRTAVQKKRVLPDCTLVKRMNPTIRLAHFIPNETVGKIGEWIMNRIFTVYYRIFCLLLDLSGGLTPAAQQYGKKTCDSSTIR